MTTRTLGTFEKKFQPVTLTGFPETDNKFIPVLRLHETYELKWSNNVWTLIQNAVGTYWVPGMHSVDVIGFTYTLVPWVAADELDEYRYW